MQTSKSGNTFSASRVLLAFLIVAAFIIMQSCEKIFMEPDASADPETIFEEIWDFTDKHYSFFEYKNIDWHEAYRRYRPLIRANMNIVDLFDICAEMLYELKDGHVNLVSSFDRSRYWEWYLNSPENFNYSLLEREYFKGRQRFVGPLQFMIMNNVIYVYYGSFSNPVSDNNLDVVIASLEGKAGLIIDVRNNGGGSILNAKRIASRFTEERRHVGDNYVKTGPGYNNFRTENIFIEPHDGKRFTGKVVVLTNRSCYSATTYFTQYMSVMPNVTFVGDTTGGGGGLPAFHDLPNGWLLRVSSTQFFSPLGFNIEAGIPPDIKVDMSDESMLAGKDDILEKALEIIRSGR